MLRTALRRKNVVDHHLLAVDSMINSSHKHTDMCLSYVIVFAAVEFMAESIVRGWLVHNIRKHKVGYPHKRRVDELINALYNNAEINLRKNNTIDYSRLCELIIKLAGDVKGNEFKRLVAAASPAGVSATTEALKRISIFRHRLAHGINTPDEMSPNLSELRADFNQVYTNLIVNLDQVLRRS